MTCWTYDGPRQSSQPWSWHWSCYQGKAYPNPLPGEAERNQVQRDEERLRRTIAQETFFKHMEGDPERRIAAQRRQKKGRSIPPLHRPRGRS